MSFRRVLLPVATLKLFAHAPAAGATDDKTKAAAATEEYGKIFDAEGIPTFKIQEDGTVDWYTFSGFRRFNADCHVCLFRSVLRLMS